MIFFWAFDVQSFVPEFCQAESQFFGWWNFPSKKTSPQRAYPGTTHEGQRGEIIAHLPGLVREPAAGKCALANFFSRKKVEASE